TVPGEDGAQAKSLATTAKLYVRPVQGQPQPAMKPGQAQPTPGQAQPTPAATPTAEPTPTSEAPTPTTEAPQNRVFPAQAPTPTPSPSPSPGQTSAQQTQAEIAAAKALRQSTDQATQIKAMATLDCSKPDPLEGNDDPKLPLVTCSTDGQYVYLLDPSVLDGQEISNATNRLDAKTSRWVVDVDFKSGGADTWGKLTTQYLNKQLAFTLDSRVVSAPVVQSGAQFGGSTEISGNFNGTTSKELANSLKYGSLPLSFATSEAETVSATLGISSLHAGLIAGAIGLVAVLLYCLLYYRMLGFLAGFSLLAAGVAVYALIVLLGRWIGFTLDLAGIAGLIIGIGMTADSFVVFFERIKDQMREGRSFRSAVPRGWQRAQRTNLSGKTVSLIASAVLYLLAAGQVKGFAFTLGLTTVLDVIVLYLVTSPLMMLVSRSPFWAKPSVNGLGAIAELAQERKATAGVLVKEA
ncbi:protein translocase subunit SecD, partial [Nocardia sp. NPDC004722]